MQAGPNQNYLGIDLFYFPKIANMLNAFTVALLNT